MYRSGTSAASASHARTMLPTLCPSSVNRGQRASSTHTLFLRNTKCSVAGSRAIPIRLRTFSRITSFDASTSPEYTTHASSGCVRWMCAIAVHSTRSPPPPALLKPTD
jgi:hypothetical protein